MKEIKEIEAFLREIKKSNIFLTPKEKIFIKHLLKEGLQLKEIKAHIKKELKKYPPEKRKKIPLDFLLKDINQKSKKRPKTSLKRQNTENKMYMIWKSYLTEHNIPLEILSGIEKLDNLTHLEIKGKVINYLWKNISQEEKEKIKREALLKIKKNYLISKVDKEILKSYIAKILEEKYNIPD